MQTRRQFMAGSAAATALLGLLPRQAMATVAFETIEAMTASVQLAPDGYPATDIWGYGGTAPGPVLRVAQGGRLQRRLVNSLPQAHSIHWHGIRIDNAMDGVPGLTQAAVEPGDGFDYDFVLPDAGTYWYHSHNRSMEQVARGLHGALIVEEDTPPDIDREEVLVLDDWLIDPETGQISGDFESAHARSHAGRLGNLVLTNGIFDKTMTVQRNERLRLRLINAANARIFALGLFGLEGWTMALDGMPLPAPEPLEEVVVLGPGQRADLIVDVIAEQGSTAYLARADEARGTPQVSFQVRGQASLARRGTPDALPPNPGDAFNLSGDSVDLTLNMEGGAMGTLRGAMLDGEETGFREMAQANQFWAFNGMVGMPDTPLATLDRGQIARLTISNDTAFPHAMHLHGIHFREVLADGTLGPMRDTLLMDSAERREIAFAADNPGDWLLHCHMLSHAVSGMMTWVRVA
ncbi:multicopper oxidase family protein [Alterinioella nitratireducens]|uniref:multicopper oxidase family protein n=1 Tax=Alterinioella nitratireducens TaxID=2735915 RepID=UPI001556D392|nr:multicopper oxidase family protein [Alterinioella nitratireducens]NPD20955.1 multicopper oxidase family protein [Alterinioella nitratireducens]